MELIIAFALLALFAVAAFLAMLIWQTWDWGKDDGYWPRAYPHDMIKIHLDMTPRWLWPWYHRAYRAGQAKRERMRNKPEDPRVTAEADRILRGE